MPGSELGGLHVSAQVCALLGWNGRCRAQVCATMFGRVPCGGAGGGRSSDGLQVRARHVCVAGQVLTMGSSFVCMIVCKRGPDRAGGICLKLQIV